MNFDPNSIKVKNPKVISLKVMIDLVTAGKVKFSEKSIFRLVVTLKPHITEC